MLKSPLPLSAISSTGCIRMPMDSALFLRLCSNPHLQTRFSVRYHCREDSPHGILPTGPHAARVEMRSRSRLSRSVTFLCRISRGWTNGICTTACDPRLELHDRCRPSACVTLLSYVVAGCSWPLHCRGWRCAYRIQLATRLRPERLVTR